MKALDIGQNLSKISYTKWLKLVNKQLTTACFFFGMVQSNRWNSLHNKNGNICSSLLTNFSLADTQHNDATFAEIESNKKNQEE